MARRKKTPLARGLIRDKNGVVVGRRSQHPYTRLLTAIPMSSADYPDAQIPPMNMPEEVKHLLAIHVFDNLYPGLPLPPEPGEKWTITDAAGAVAGEVAGSKYRLVNPTGDVMPAGGNGEEWVAHSLPGESIMPDVVVEGVPDVDGLDDAQFEALQARVVQRIEDEARLAAMDTQAKPTKPEWVRWKEDRNGGGDL